MTLLAELLRRSSERLVTEADIDAGLAGLASEVEDTGGGHAAVVLARKHVSDRLLALGAASQELDRLRVALTRIGDVLPFTEEGWPERKEELEKIIAADIDDGLASWLSDWFAAAASRRLDALQRLGDVERIPPAAGLLVERCATAARGLEMGSWYPAHAVLTAGARGIEAGRQSVPSLEVRTELWLMLARLALNDLSFEVVEERRDRLAAEVDLALREAEATAPPAKVAALRARRLRLLHQAAGTELDAARAAGSADLDVAVELIESVATDNHSDAALDFARHAIDALPTLTDSDAEIGKLIAVPVELWTALAERALGEKDFSVYDHAIEKAGSFAAWDDHRLQAALAELRVEAADYRNRPSDEGVAALAAAGDQRLWAGQLEAAVRLYERALELDPNHVDAALSLADAVVTLAQTHPPAVRRTEAKRALDLIEDVQRRDGITAATSWSYLSEAAARAQLAEFVDGPKDAGWRAFLAVCRSIPHAPVSALRWTDLASAAEGLELSKVTQAATTYAIRLDPEDPAALATHIRTLANAGRFSEALALLGESAEAWETAVRGYVLFRMGEREDAIRILQSSEIDANWLWANEVLVSALLVTGRSDEALAEAHLLRARGEERREEVRGVLAAASAESVIGNFERAEELAAPLMADNQEAGLVVGEARLLRGDAAGGLAALKVAIDVNRSARWLDDVRGFYLDQIVALGTLHDVALPTLNEVEAWIEDRRRELAKTSTPVAELEGARAAGAAPGVVDAAKLLGLALVYIALGEPGRAVQALEGRDDVDESIPLLRRYATNVEVARAAVRAAQGGIDDDAATRIRKLIDEMGSSAGELLRLEAEAGSPRDALVRVLEGVATEPDHSGAIAAGMLALFGNGRAQPDVGTQEPVRPIELVLPPSWFQGNDDPFNEHPLFLSYIPELRARSSVEIPGVNVRTDEGLEPDTYVILALGDVAETGRVDARFRYGTREAVDMLGLRDRGEPVEALGLVRVPRELREDDRLASLLTMAAAEVVARRVAEVAQTHAAQLGGASNGQV